MALRLTLHSQIFVQQSKVAQKFLASLFSKSDSFCGEALTDGEASAHTREKDFCKPCEMANKNLRGREMRSISDFKISPRTVLSLEERTKEQNELEDAQNSLGEFCASSFLLASPSVRASPRELELF